MKVLWLTNIPSPYRVDFFNELSKNCDLTVLFEERRRPERDKSWKSEDPYRFHYAFLSGFKLGFGRLNPSVITKIKKNHYDCIVVSNVANPTGILAILWMKIRKIPYVVEGDGGFAGSGRGLKERLKKFLISGASLGFSSGRLHDEYYRRYGLSDKKIVRYPFTSLYEKDILHNAPGVDDKEKIREKLGITEKKVVLSIGQFIHRKGFDVLLEAQRRLDDVSALYIVGGTPTSEYLDLVAKYRLKNVHFVGFKNKAELKLYYQAADVFVLPTREDIWGLVINEALANACPVVTTDRCASAFELIDGNGFIVPVESADGLADKIRFLLGDDEARYKASRRSLEVISEYTFEKMATRHLEVFAGKVC